MKKEKELANYLKATFWDRELNAVKNSKKYKSWETRCKANFKRYNNEEENKVGYNLLFKAVNTIMPFIIPYLPEVIVSRRNEDDDKVGALACEILGRAVNNTITNNVAYNDVIRLATLNGYLANMGQVWFRYEVDKEKQPVMQQGMKPIYDEMTGEQVGEEPYEEQALDEKGKPVFEEKIKDERLVVDLVDWENFFFNNSKTKNDIQWMGRRLWLTKKEFEERFPDTDTSEYAFDGESINKTEEVKAETDKKCEVFEIWYKPEKKVIYYSKKNKDTKDSIILCQDNTLNIDFPCPMPLQFNQTSDNLIATPIPSQVEYQAKMTDLLEGKIHNLIKMTSVRGGFASNLSDFGKMVSEDNDNKLVPINNSEAFLEKGGLQQGIFFMPLDVITSARVSSMEDRSRLITDYMEMMGVNPIVEGQTNSNEAYGTNRIKGSFGTMRIQEYQRIKAVFLKECAEIACEFLSTFEIDSLIKMSNSQFLPEYQEYQQDPENSMLTQAIYRLQDKEEGLKYSLEIDVESTKAFYDDTYRNQLNNYLTSLIEDLNTLSQVSQISPTLLAPFKEVLLAKIRSHRIGRRFNAGFENAINQAVEQMMQPPPPPQPDPMIELKKQQMQQEMAIAQMKYQTMESMADKKVAQDNYDADILKQINDEKVRVRVQEVMNKKEIEYEKLALRYKELEAELELKRQAQAMGLNPRTNIGV